MRLITLSLFFLLAVSAAGQPIMHTVGISTYVVRGQGQGLYYPSQEDSRRQCSGLILTPKWVLTAGHCVFSDVSVNPTSMVVYGADGSAQRPLKVVAEADPEYDRVRPVFDDRTPGNLALIHMACPVDARLEQGAEGSLFVSSWVAAGADGLSRLLANNPGGIEVTVNPYPRINPDTGRLDRFRFPDRQRFRRGLAQKVNDVWTFQSSSEPLPEEAVDGSPVVWDTPPVQDGRGAVGIYTGEVDGVPTFVDLSTKWEWISKTVRDESLYLPELCRAAN